MVTSITERSDSHLAVFATFSSNNLLSNHVCTARTVLKLWRVKLTKPSYGDGIRAISTATATALHTESHLHF